MQRGQNGGRIAEGLIDEQVGNRADRRIEDVAGARIARAVRHTGRVVDPRRICDGHQRGGAVPVRIDHDSAELSAQRLRKLVVCGPPFRMQQVIVGAINRPQTPADIIRRHRAGGPEQGFALCTSGLLVERVVFCDLDLRKNELEIAFDVLNHTTLLQALSAD